MPGRWPPSRCVLLLWAVTILGSPPLIHLPLSHAADEVAVETGEMKTQREAYQSQHNLVKAVQKRLDTHGYRPGPIDGILGPQTRGALMAFQKDNALKVDGLIGIKTLRKLDLIRTLP